MKPPPTQFVWEFQCLLEPPDRRVWSSDILLLQCWETRLGQEMYKLVLFDLLMGLLVTLLVQFPRK